MEKIQDMKIEPNKEIEFWKKSQKNENFRISTQNSDKSFTKILYQVEERLVHPEDKGEKLD